MILGKLQSSIKKTCFYCQETNNDHFVLLETINLFLYLLGHFCYYTVADILTTHFIFASVSEKYVDTSHYPLTFQCIGVIILFILCTLVTG